MNIYANRDKNAIRLLAVLVLGIFLVSMVPTQFADEKQTLYSGTPAVPATNEIIEFFNSYVEEVENSQSKTAWQRLDTPLQTYVETGTPTADMRLHNGQPRVQIFALPGFDISTLPEGLTVTRSADLQFMVMIEALVSDPISVLEAASQDGVAMLEADVYLPGFEPAEPAIPTLETERPRGVQYSDQLTQMARDVFEAGQEPDRFVVREISGVNAEEVDSGYIGTGVTIGIDDTGVDFGVPGLAYAQDLDATGLPTSYDDSGEGFLYAPRSAFETLSGIIPVGDDWMYDPLHRSYAGGSDQAFDYWIYYAFLDMPLNTGPGGSWRTITVPTGISLSGVWKVGITRIGPGGSTYRWACALFADPTTPGVYDRLYIDWEATWAVSAMYNSPWYNFEWGMSEINWDITDEHGAGDFWDLTTTPAAALADPSVWAMANDYYNGSFYGWDTHGRHVNTTVNYAHTTTAAANYSSFILEYQWITNPYMPATDLVNRHNITMDTDWDPDAGDTTEAEYMLNGLFDAGDSLTYRIIAVNDSNEAEVEVQGWTTAAVVDASATLAPPDGYPDISLGSLSNGMDAGGWTNDADGIVNLMTTDPDACYAYTMYDNGVANGHGTHCAWTAAARTTADHGSIPWYDVYGNETTYPLRGQAPGATIRATKIFSSGSFEWSWLWQAGIVPVVEADEQNYFEYDATLGAVDIMSNSWGSTSFYANQWEDMVMQALMVPNSFDATFPGMLVVFSAGNSGPGYQSSWGPHSHLSIQVGAVTTGHSNDDFYGPNQLNNDLAPFTSKSPGVYGQPTIDIMGWGAWETTGNYINSFWDGYEAVSTFGGTSAAAPNVAGTIAVVYEAIAASAAPAYLKTPLAVKSVVKSTADSLEADPFSQGAGLINVQRAVDFYQGANGEYVWWTNITNVNMEMFMEDYVREVWTEWFGINYNYDNTIGMDTSFYTGVMNPGDSMNASYFQMATDGSDPDTGTPTAQHHVRDAAKAKWADFSNNATWDAAQNDSLISVYNGINYTAWDLTTSLFTDDAGLMAWTTDDGMVAFQVNTQGSFPDAAPYFYLHGWKDTHNGTHPVADGGVNYRNATGGGGEVRRISFIYSGGDGQGTMWVRADTLWDLANNGWTIILVEGTGFHPDADDGDFTHLNYTIWADFYEIVPWSWVTVDPTRNTDDSFNVTVAVPAAAEPGIYQGFLQYGAGNATLPIDVWVSGTATEYNATTLTADVTWDNTPGLIYDNAEFRQGDQGDPSPDSRMWVVDVDQWNATGMIVTQNWTAAGMDMVTWIMPFISGSFAGSDRVGEGQSSATAMKLTTKAPVSMGSYIVYTEVWGFGADIAFEYVDTAFSWVYDLPNIEATINGEDWPADGDAIGLLSDYGSSNLTLTWAPDAATAATYPDLAVTESTLGAGVPPEDYDYEYTYGTDMSDQYAPRDFTDGDPYWFWYAGTVVDITVTWEVNSGADEMDALFYPYPQETGADLATLGTAGGSPEADTVVIPADGEYWLIIHNFAGTQGQHGHIIIHAEVPADAPSAADSNIVSFNTYGMSEAPTWALIGTAVDTWGYSYRLSTNVVVRNISPPDLDLTMTLTGNVASGVVTLTIDVVDANNANTETYDDQNVYLHLYYTADEAGNFLIPIATWVDVTTQSSSDTTDYSFSWDTTLAFNTYVARLWIVGDDLTGTSTFVSDVFEISNTEGEAAGIASSESNIGAISLALMLVAVLGIGAIPMLRKLWRIRRL